MPWHGHASRRQQRRPEQSRAKEQHREFSGDWLERKCRVASVGDAQPCFVQLRRSGHGNRQSDHAREHRADDDIECARDAA